MAILSNDVWHSAVTLDMLALESNSLNSSFDRLKFVWWWCTAPMKMVEKGMGSGTTWIRLWIEQGMDIPYGYGSKKMDRR